MKDTSLFSLVFSAALSLAVGLGRGRAGIGCMAMSWILLGRRLGPSVGRDIRSTCSKMEAEDNGSSMPFIGGGPMRTNTRECQTSQVQYIYSLLFICLGSVIYF